MAGAGLKQVIVRAVDVNGGALRKEVTFEAAIYYLNHECC